MNTSAAVAINVSKPWFSALTSHRHRAHIVGLSELNVNSPHLLAPHHQEGQAVIRPWQDAAAPAFLELPDKAGGAVPHSNISRLCRMRTMIPVNSTY